MKKNIVLLSILTLITNLSIYGQFNTVRPKEKEKETEIENIVEQSQKNSKEISSIQSVNNPDLQESTRKMIDTMRKRQLVSPPVDDIKITSNYGYRNDPFTGKRQFHKGIDIATDYNYVYSIMPGKIIKSGKNRTLGEFVQVDHGEFRTTYGHLSKRLVEAKEAVEAGQPIGISGNTGRSTGEHLHLGMSFKGKTIDPQPIIEYILKILNESKQELENAIKQFSIPK